MQHRPTLNAGRHHQIQAKLNQSRHEQSKIFAARQICSNRGARGSTSRTASIFAMTPNPKKPSSQLPAALDNQAMLISLKITITITIITITTIITTITIYADLQASPRDDRSSSRLLGGDSCEPGTSWQIN